jgi:hypothetical protein
MSRHDRRASAARSRRADDLAAFKHDVAHGGGLVTYLIGCDDEAIDREPLFAKAVIWWRGNIRARRYTCTHCSASFAEGAQVGAWLFATSPAAPNSASISAFCLRCFSSLPDDELERAAMKVLRKILPNAEFER